MANLSLIVTAAEMNSSTPLKAIPQSMVTTVGGRSLTLQPGQQWRLVQCKESSMFLESFDSCETVIGVFSYSLSPGSPVVANSRAGEQQANFQLFDIKGPYLLLEASNGTMALTLDLR